ncbi:MAG: hypothetical protein ACF8MF_04255 [Phycisphaerales bacterium JB052]
MNHPSRSVLLLLAMFILAFQLGLSRVQPATTLDPGQPRQYLEQGELLLVRAKGNDELALARQILAMGAVLAHRAGQDGIAASCCIAVAAAHDDAESVQLAWDLALILDPSRLAAWAQQRNRSTTTGSATLGAECLRLARNAEPADASELYRNASVREAINQSAERLGFSVEDVTQSIRALLDTSGQDQCRGRVFTTRVQDGESIRVLCDDHTHPIATTGDVRSLQMLLAIELDCLGASAELEDWGSARVMHQQRPFNTPSIDQLIEAYQIDPARPYLIDGRWSSTR